MKPNRFTVALGLALAAVISTRLFSARFVQAEMKGESRAGQGKQPLFSVMTPRNGNLLVSEEGVPEPAPSAEVILKESNKRMYHLKDQTSQVTFRVVQKNGTEKKSVFRLYWKNYYGKENVSSKTLLVTEAPAHDRGEKFLLWERPEESQADIWLYLPELRQVRRLQSGGHHHHDKEDDSDLLFEDIHQRPVEKDEHKLMEDQEARGELCYVIESRLKGHPLYGKKILFISKNEGTLRKIEYFSEEGTLLKTQWIDWQKVDDQLVWKKSEVINAQSSRKTFVELSDIRINVGLPDDQFSERALRS